MRELTLRCSIFVPNCVVYTAPGIYPNNQCYQVYKDDIKFKTPSIQKTKNTGRRIQVFQKNRYKMQTNKNPFEHNTDYMWIMHRMQFRNFFKKTEKHPCSCNFTKRNTPPSVFFTFLKLYK